MSAGRKFMRLLAAMLAAPLLISCGGATLLEDPVRTTSGDAELQRISALYGSAVWERSAELSVQLTDRWQSTWLRWLTPLPSNEQRLALRFSPGGARIQLEFLDGERQGQVIGLDEGECYTIEAGRPHYSSQPLTRLYLESLVDHIEVLYRLARRPRAARLNARPCGEGLCNRIFAGPNPDGTEDQNEYVLWMDAAGGSPRYVDFTGGGFYAGSRSILRLAGLVRGQGLTLPGQIDVLSSMNDSAPLRSLQLESIVVH
ncbi:MAG: hypothetical protein K1X75_08475 [Leptospirales bacterium]|nr:hypothetical protein [Leptospirales bacterium]